MVRKVCDDEKELVELGKTGRKHDVPGTQDQLIERYDQNCINAIELGQYLEDDFANLLDSRKDCLSNTLALPNFSCPSS